MGYSISWIALRGKKPEEAANLLGLAATGDFEEVPESMFCGASLDTGWYLVVINQHGHRLVQETSLRALSADCEVVAAAIEEHVMSSCAEYWQDGRRRWSVGHESESGASHLAETGVFPESYRSIKERLLAAQTNADGVDYVFDVPLELAEAVVGFKHDQSADLQFQVLEAAAQPGSPGLLRRLFGKK